MTWQTTGPISPPMRTGTTSTASATPATTAPSAGKTASSGGRRPKGVTKTIAASARTPGVLASRGRAAKHALWIASRGFVQVCPVAVNTVFIARGEVLPAMLVAFAISAIWWRNAGSAARTPGDWIAYAAGGALGTGAGMQAAAWI